MPDIPQDDEISLEELWRISRKGLPFVAAVTILAALVTFLLVRQAPPVYQATATLLSSQPGSTSQSFNVSLVTAPKVDVSAYKAAVMSKPVLGRALQAENMPVTRQAIASMRKEIEVSAEQARDSSLIHVAVRGLDPERAASVANAVASSLLVWDKDRATSHLQAVIDTLQSQIKALDQAIATQEAAPSGSATDASGMRQLRAQQTLELDSAEALKSSAIGRLEIVDLADVPLAAVGPRPRLASMIAGVLALFAAFLVVFIRAALDSRYHSVDEMARSLQLNVVGEFPALRRGVRILPRADVNFLRTNLSFVSAAAHPKIFLVTSAESGDGKTTVAVSLARAYARNDFRTLLIDGDLRKPDVVSLLKVTSNEATDAVELMRNPSQRPIPIRVDADRARFDVIPTSHESEDATELLSQGFRGLIDRVKDYDVIIIDSAPILPVPDTLVMAPHATGTILVASISETDKRHVNRVCDQLRQLGVNMLGLVVTHVTAPQQRGRGSGYGYGYGYGYYGQSHHGKGDDFARSVGQESVATASVSTHVSTTTGQD